MWWVFSPEDLPSFREGWAREFVMYQCHTIGPLEAGAWFELPRQYSRRAYRDYQDQVGHLEVVTAAEVAEFVNRVYGARGVVAVPGTVYADEARRAEIEKLARERNIEFRRRAIAEFEEQCEQARQLGLKLPKASPWLKEGYAMLNMTDPTSFEATVALRNPGSNTAREIAGQLEGVLSPLVQAVDGLARMVADLRGTSNTSGKKTRHDKGVVGLVREGADDDRELAGEVSFGDVA